MTNTLMTLLKRLSNYFRCNPEKYSGPAYPVDFSEEDRSIIQSVKNYTMTGPERLYALIQSVKYIVDHDVEGAIVECGVWKGGSMMAVANTLLKLDTCDRDLYLFDTFEGMTKPDKNDVSYSGTRASDHYDKKKIGNIGSSWCAVGLADVKKSLYNTGYPARRLHFVEGRVEETIPRHAPSTISILRLDTDWYNSTKHELINLYPRLSRGGVIIIDDYGHWKGAKQAVDEYFTSNNIPILLNRIDYTARIGVKI